MQTTLIPDVYNKVINALKHNHPEYMENINELAKLWKENLIKGDNSLADKIIETEIEPPHSVESLEESNSETETKPFVLLDSFKRFELSAREDRRPPKRFRASIPIPQYDGSNGMPSDDEEVDSSSIVINERHETHNDENSSQPSSSDDEHNDENFSSPNVVVCQYSQLAKRDHKWKLKLSKGVCYINNRNYVFGSCKAEILVD